MAKDESSSRSKLSRSLEAAVPRQAARHRHAALLETPWEEDSVWAPLTGDRPCGARAECDILEKEEGLRSAVDGW